MQRLDEVLAHGPVTPRDALRIVTEIGRRLVGMHAAGECHLAVEPAAVSLDRNGSAHLMAAAFVSEADRAYQAPEILRGEEGDWRSDVWSVGVLFYRLWADAEPFWGTTDETLRGAILEGEPEGMAPTAAVLPAAAERLLRRSLAKSHTQRYATVEEWRQDLEALHEEPTGSLQGREASPGMGAPPVPTASRPAPSMPPRVQERVRLLRESSAGKRPSSLGALLVVPSLALLLVVGLLLYC